ncbi:MAG: hypothetical protein QOJ11_2633 [Frankiales bacterium]|nr:hypothetical protein [Frankiales bacterium]
MTVWLSVDTLGWVMLQTPGRGGIACLLSDPGDSFNMPELDGRIEVERDVAVTAFAQHLGQSVQRVTPLWTRHPSGKRISAGFVAHYRDGAVAVVDIGDELLIDSWPSPPLVDAGLVDDFPGSDS